MKRIFPLFLCFIFLLLYVFAAAGCIIGAPGAAGTPTTTIAEQTVEENDGGQVITLPACLEYGDEQWREIEECFIDDIVENMPYEYGIYDASELSREILESRKGKIIIERCVGFVVNKETGDGRILNPYNKDADYISYRSVTNQSYRDGTVFVSYMIYNPENNYIDDISERYDFVLCREWEG